MRRADIVSLALLIGLGLALGACRGGAERDANRRPTTDAVREDAPRAEALRQIDALQAAVDRARAGIEAEAAAAQLPRQRQLQLSEIRRAIVVANVSLQKARAAFVQGDYATVARETSAARARLETTPAEAGSRR